MFRHAGATGVCVRLLDLGRRLFHCDDDRRRSKLRQPGPRAEIQ